MDTEQLEITSEIADQMKELPSWLVEPTEPNEKGDFIWKVDVFGKVYELKELKGSSYEAAVSFANKMKHDELKVILQRGLEGQIGALELDNLRGREYLRLKSSLTYVYGFNDF